MSSRERVGSIISSIAIILVISDWFFDTNIFGIRLLYLGIFLFIIRGMLLNIIFGPKKRRSRRERIIRNNLSIESKYCQSCGTANEAISVFCIQCGSAFSNNQSANQENSYQK